MPRYVVIHGPNLDRLGTREPHIYGRQTLADLDSDLRQFAAGLAIELTTFQSNREGEIVEMVKESDNDFEGVVVNPGALTHYSRTLGDAVSAISIPVVEVHISNILEREPWRRHSVLAPSYRIYGRGRHGYRWALRHLHNRSQAPSERIPYGPLPDQYGDLRRVSSQSTLVVLVHGGLWRHEWTADTTESIALDLFHRGFSTLNLEYRRVGLGGGWPESFSDIAMALARIPDLTGFSPDQTLVLGHSAGATMALWADHPGLGLALAPFCDLVEARQQRLAGDTFARLLEEPLDDPAAYSPAHRLPRRAPTVIFASPADRVVPIEAIRRYRDAAKESQSQVDLVTTDGGHFDFLEPSTATWGLVIETMEARKATV